MGEFLGLDGGGRREQTQRIIGYLDDLSTAWHEAEPGNGYDVKAVEWRAKLIERDNDADPH
ncbi:MAG: hypothetical protein AAFX05_01500 [Planctomycetota bacterium]